MLHVFFLFFYFLILFCFRLSVLSAITSVQQRLKLYNKVPPNGLVIYCGTIVTDDGKEKKVNIDFEPFRPINTSLYLCDNKFHTEVKFPIFVFFKFSNFSRCVIAQP